MPMLHLAAQKYLADNGDHEAPESFSSDELRDTLGMAPIAIPPKFPHDRVGAIHSGGCDGNIDGESLRQVTSGGRQSVEPSPPALALAAQSEPTGAVKPDPHRFLSSTVGGLRRGMRYRLAGPLSFRSQPCSVELRSFAEMLVSF